MSNLVSPEAELLVCDDAKDFCHKKMLYCGIDNTAEESWTLIQRKDKLLLKLLEFGIGSATNDTAEVSLTRAFRLGASVAYCALDLNEDPTVPVLGTEGVRISWHIFNGKDVEELFVSSLSGDPNLSAIIDTLTDEYAGFEKFAEAMDQEEKRSARIGAGFTHFLLDTQYKLTNVAEFN